jgi:hypothetical protein
VEGSNLGRLFIFPVADDTLDQITDRKDVLEGNGGEAKPFSSIII